MKLIPNFTRICNFTQTAETLKVRTGLNKRPRKAVIFPLYSSISHVAIMQRLEEAEQQAEASVDVPYPPLQIVNSVFFCLFSLYLYSLSAPFLNPLSSRSPSSLLSLLVLLR